MRSPWERCELLGAGVRVPGGAVRAPSQLGGHRILVPPRHCGLGARSQCGRNGRWVSRGLPYDTTANSKGRSRRIRPQCSGREGPWRSFIVDLHTGWVCPARFREYSALGGLVALNNLSHAMNTLYETLGQLRVIGCRHQLFDPCCETELRMLGSDRCKSSMRAVQQKMMLIVNPAAAANADACVPRMGCYGSGWPGWAGRTGVAWPQLASCISEFHA